jgi:hypothetical protein
MDVSGSARADSLSGLELAASEHIRMAFPAIALLVTVLVFCIGHPSILVARRAQNADLRRLASHLALATLCVAGALTLLTVLRPDGNWLTPAFSLCSLAIGATFDVGRRDEEVMF